VLSFVVLGACLCL